MAIQLTNASIRAACEAHLGERPEDGRLHILGLRSATPATPTAVTLHAPQYNRFDDTLAVFGTELHAWPGTVDPGRTYTERPLNAQGAAHLRNGVWLFKPGLHRGLPALVQAGPVTVQRDRDRDGKAEPGEPIQTGYFGIEIHRMGNGPTVNDWSAGCSGMHVPAFEEFWAFVKASGQGTFRYWLLDGSALL